MEKLDFKFKLGKLSSVASFLMCSFLILSVGTSCASTKDPFSTEITTQDLQSNQEGVNQKDLKYFNLYKKERELYVKALEAYESKDLDKVREYRSELNNYPLAIYLDYLLLSDASADLNTNLNFIKNSGHQNLSNRLKANLIVIYSKRSQYDKVLAISPTEPNSDYLKCHWYAAKYYLGKDKTQVTSFIKNLYHNAMPLYDGCASLVNNFKSKKIITNDDTFIRLTNSYWTRNNVKVYRDSARELSKTGYKGAVTLLNKYYERTSQYDKIPPKYSKTAFLVFKRYARQNPRNALDKIDDFVKRYHISKKDRLNLERVIVSNLLFERYDLPVDFIDKRLNQYNDKDLYVRRIRLAIWQKDYLAILKYVKKLPKAQQQKENVRYWLAYAYEKTNKKAEATKIYSELAKERCFYCYLAADKVNKPYVVAPGKLNNLKSRENLIIEYPAYARFVELEFLKDDKGLKTEWFELMNNANLSDARAIAKIESDRGYPDLAVWETINKKDWDNLEVRFPIVYENTYRSESKAQNVKISYLLGITRQESIMNPLAKSPVGARGLMQLMPGTAKDLSKRNNYVYSGAESLFNPQVNIKFGATYLRELLEQFNGNRIYATASYNAGPARALKWQSKDGVTRDMETYIESIPFEETRNYVQRVIFYDYMYQYLLGEKHLEFLSKEERKGNY